MNTEDFLAKLQGFFNEKETFFSCQEELKNIRERQNEAMEHMERLQGEIREATELPFTYFYKIKKFFFFWK